MTSQDPALASGVVIAEGSAETSTGRLRSYLAARRSGREAPPLPVESLDLDGTFFPSGRTGQSSCLSDEL
jgi:hypothetical protein